MALKAWRTFSRAITERPIRLLSLVVFMWSLVVLHGVAAFLLVVALHGPEGWTVFLFPFLEIVGWGGVLVLLALRLWGIRLGASAIRLARSFGGGVKERPRKLLAGILLVAAIPWTVFFSFFFLLLLFWGFDSEFWGPAFGFMVPGIAVVLFGFYLWGEGKRAWVFYLVWFVAAALIYEETGAIWQKMTPRRDAWLVHNRRERLQAERDQRQETAPQESDESEVPGQSLEQWEPRTDVEEVDPRDD